MSNIVPKGFVCHLSASQWGTVADIRKWHKARGFADIGYAKVILNGIPKYDLKYDAALDGAIKDGRKPETAMGAHCLAEGMNSVTLGVCCIGTPGFTPEGPEYLPAGPTGRVCRRQYMTRKQHASLINTLARLCKRYGVDPLGTFEHLGKTHPTITQHSDHDPIKKPECASLNMDVVRNQVAAEYERLFAVRL